MEESWGRGTLRRLQAAVLTAVLLYLDYNIRGAAAVAMGGMKKKKHCFTCGEHVLSRSFLHVTADGNPPPLWCDGGCVGGDDCCTYTVAGAKDKFGAWKFEACQLHFGEHFCSMREQTGETMYVTPVPPPGGCAWRLCFKCAEHNASVHKAMQQRYVQEQALKNHRTLAATMQSLLVANIVSTSAAAGLATQQRAFGADVQPHEQMVMQAGDTAPAAFTAALEAGAAAQQPVRRSHRRNASSASGVVVESFNPQPPEKPMPRLPLALQQQPTAAAAPAAPAVVAAAPAALAVAQEAGGAAAQQPVLRRGHRRNASSLSGITLDSFDPPPQAESASPPPAPPQPAPAAPAVAPQQLPEVAAVAVPLQQVPAVAAVVEAPAAANQSPPFYEAWAKAVQPAAEELLLYAMLGTHFTDSGFTTKASGGSRSNCNSRKFYRRIAPLYRYLTGLGKDSCTSSSIERFVKGWNVSSQFHSRKRSNMFANQTQRFVSSAVGSHLLQLLHSGVKSTRRKGRHRVCVCKRTTAAAQAPVEPQQPAGPLLGAGAAAGEMEEAGRVGVEAALPADAGPPGAPQHGRGKRAAAGTEVQLGGQIAPVAALEPTGARPARKRFAPARLDV